MKEIKLLPNWFSLVLIFNKRKTTNEIKKKGKHFYLCFVLSGSEKNPYHPTKQKSSDSKWSPDH